MRKVVFPLFIFFSYAVLLYSTLLPSIVNAEDVRLRAEFTYTDGSSTIMNKNTGDATESEFSSFKHLYDLSLSKDIYPTLTFIGGGLIELENSTSTTGNIESERDETVIRPYVELNLNSSPLSAGTGFRRTEIKQEVTGVPSARDFKDDLNASFGWRPVGFPQVSLFYNSSHIYNDSDTVDSFDKALTLKARHTILDALPVNYTYVRTETDNEITNFTIVTQAHSGNVNYSRGFFNRRLFLDTGYRVKHETTELPGGLVSQRETSPVLRSDGLFSLDNTPEDGPAPASVTALIDGNLTASGGIDIGWDNAGGDSRNIGLDFGAPLKVSKIYIWVDRNILATAANSFSWSVYTSAETGNLTDTSIWTLQAIVSPATFGVFQTRFEISFPEVEARYIKVVVNPLSSAFSGTTELKNIYVTEIEAFTTILSQTGTTLKISNTEHNYSLNLTGKLSSKTSLGYNFFYRLRETDPTAEKRTALSNGLFLSHTFNDVFAASARLSRDDSELISAELISKERVTYTYSAHIKASYMETFGQTFTYSGTKTTENDGTSDSSSIFLRNNAKLYKGWDAYLDTGYNWYTSKKGGQANSTVIRTGTNLVPNDKVTINLRYSAVDTKSSEPGTMETSTSQKTLDLQTFYLPYKTLSLFARITIDDRDASKKTYMNYSANWAPFPDGDLQLSLNYTETLRPADDREERTMGPGLRWNISRHATFETSYYITKSETNLETVDSSNIYANLRMVF